MGECHFAINGAAAAFETALPVGQLYFPDWDRYENAMRGIFERQYYTNNGPLLTKLEDHLSKFLGVKHAICVTNATFGLMMIPEAMQLTGEVILPSFTFIASVQSLSWAKIIPRFSDVDPITHQIDVKKLESLMTKDVSAIMAVNLWGGASDIAALTQFAKKHGIQLYFDSAHAFGCEVDGKKIGSFGDAEVFSFHATKILSAAEGGCITTNDDLLASRLRAIRPSYGEDQPATVEKVINARMSEAQAALALMNLEDFEANRQHNEDIFNIYRKGLNAVPGLLLTEPAGVTRSNYQYVVCEMSEETFGLMRDELILVLKKENILARRYFHPGAHCSVEYKDNASAQRGQLAVTERLCQTCIQLPIGALVSLEAAEKICDLLQRIHDHAPQLKHVLQEKNVA